MDKLCEELRGRHAAGGLSRTDSQRRTNRHRPRRASIVEKLIRRHPHVFGEVKVDGSDAVLRNWEKIKAAERGEKGRFSKVFDSVPTGLPSLMRAEIVQSKASKVGFDWADFRPALDKVDEEIAELREALRSRKIEATAADPSAAVAEEIGDLLFAVVNVSRLLKIDPEGALRKTVEKFIRRFRYIEEKAAAGGVAIEDMTLEEMDELWGIKIGCSGIKTSSSGIIKPHWRFCRTGSVH